MNISATSGSSALWNLLASRQASRSSDNSQTGTSTDTSTDTTPRSALPPGPPPPPPGFDLSAMSTSQFAAMGQPPEDPIAGLDSDDDGAVSADEFGLDSANDPVKALFGAIDSDGSGALSMDEIDSFREQMTGGDDASGAKPPPPPPAGAGPGGNDVAGFLQALAERYAQMQGSTSTNADSTTATAAPVDTTA